MMTPADTTAILMLQAMHRRMKRQHARRQKRETNAAQYMVAGLNGTRAVQRRRRQLGVA